jgi:predicted transcriptional regulator
MPAPALQHSSSSTVFSVELPAAVVEALRKIVAGTGQTVEEHLAGAIEWYCHENGMGETPSASPEEMEAVREGIAQLDRGEGIPHEEVMARLKAKYGG